MTKVMSHIIGVRKEQIRKKGVRKAKSLGASNLDGISIDANFCSVFLKVLN